MRWMTTLALLGVIGCGEGARPGDTLEEPMDALSIDAGPAIDARVQSEAGNGQSVNAASAAASSAVWPGQPMLADSQSKQAASGLLATSYADAGVSWTSSTSASSSSSSSSSSPTVDPEAAVDACSACADACATANDSSDDAGADSCDTAASDSGDACASTSGADDGAAACQISRGHGARPSTREAWLLAPLLFLLTRRRA